MVSKPQTKKQTKGLKGSKQPTSKTKLGGMKMAMKSGGVSSRGRISTFMGNTKGKK